MSEDTLQIELVAADRVVWSGQATQVIARTVEGDLGVLANHAPLLSLLVPGVVEITPTEGAPFRAAVEEGFLSVADNRVSILSEDAFLADEINLEAAKSDLAEAESAEDEDAARRAEARIRAVEKTS
ncbi:MAG: F0F1 ATP synthase subunit epsilon [Actinomycetota bacterium]|nr:F0F1 ATP synthase subunit epsilon [Actinomycetota bacterium]